MKIEEIKEGQIIEGLSQKAVTVISVIHYDNSACQVVFRKGDGSVEAQLVYSADNLREVQPTQKRMFLADGDTFKLVAEARRISQAYLFDPYFAVHSSAIEPLPHQISAVYENMLPKHPLRYVLADDPGAGKTIMTGLLLKELIIRADVKRALIVSPGNLVEQWQDELYEKFNLHFNILTNENLESAASGNAFIENNFLIARLDKLSRNEEAQNKLKVAELDIVIIDEAHKLSATVMGNKVKYTKRYQLGKLLSRTTRHFLLLTATPHSGNEANFQQFMSLIDEDRFQCHSENIKVKVDTSDVMRRLVKEDLLKFDGKPLFPERIAETVSYELDGKEQQLYEDVTDYVREQFNRADNLKKDKKNAVGFALTVLQRRLASSPEAIYQSLRRRRERLEEKYDSLKNSTRTQFGSGSIVLFQSLPGEDDYDDYDDLPEDELEGMEDDMLDGATAAETLEELGKEIESLKKLESDADSLRRSNVDRKWEELAQILQMDNMKDSLGNREKLIIFTEHKDTLHYLTHKIRTLLGHNEAVITIQGGMSRKDRKYAELQFRQDKNVSILIATDAAGEGINLQRAHFMINYDLPWNPNRIEQRFGRIHRIGQTEVCRLWNLVAGNTREGDVYKRLLDKLNIERETLGGKVFDVLGRISFGDKPLKDLLIEAIRYGNDPATRARIDTVVDGALDTEHLKKLLHDYALSADVMDINRVNAIKEDMERREARKLQPYYIQAFFENAMKASGGRYHKRETGRFEVTGVSNPVIRALESFAYNQQVLRKYERICFKKDYVSIEGKPDADLMAPGHPLLDSLIAWVNKEYGQLYDDGAILLSADINEPKILCSLETSLKDGDGNTVFRQMRFVEIEKSGKMSDAGYAPYLDYDNLDEAHRTKANAIIAKNPWLTSSDFEDKVSAYAITNIIPEILKSMKDYRTKMNDRIADQVNRRLTSEINYWDKKANEYLDKIRKNGESQALRNQIASAQEKANDLAQRRKDRLAELEKGKAIVPVPPVLSSVAIVLPYSMFGQSGDVIESTSPRYGTDKDAIEKAAMEAVMNIEQSMGYIPKDVSSLNCGYDILSFVPQDKQTDGYSQRFIEVKGRSKKHESNVTVSRNEILTALNVPDQFILALVSVDGDKRETTYIRKPFDREPDSSAASINYMMSRLLEHGMVIYKD